MYLPIEFLLAALLVVCLVCYFLWKEVCKYRKQVGALNHIYHETTLKSLSMLNKIIIEREYLEGSKDKVPSLLIDSYKELYQSCEYYNRRKKEMGIETDMAYDSSAAQGLLD